ncbi:uncharacterized protein FIESC28_08350 [Fusarium coffeatum]|uniref:DEUBAD domain-containing protein n=1 Tax=Fusarium coffeatum TaxID=231269 RepID=A0A366R7N5_9HYPO|nr:uncharacterized protein FIESC28_08350 [Fusarium coffeatum]RBR13164.1 hypothetical protein FIESC28_08350 [Fusarium coffeatum]
MMLTKETVPGFRILSPASSLPDNITNMADEEKDTTIVCGESTQTPKENAIESSPLSAVPDSRFDDTPTSKAHQLPNTTATSPNDQETSPTTTPKSAKKAKARKRVVVKKTAKKSKWNAGNILTDQRSPLASADLRSILSNPMAWDVLDKEEKAEILALFPDSEHILEAGTENACPDFASLMNDDSFRRDCAAYTENIAQGRHDPEWLAEAWSAHERRKMGDFDEYLDNKFKDDWDVELPPEFKKKRGPAVSNEEGDVKMEDAEPKTNGNEFEANASLANSTPNEQKDKKPEMDSGVDALPQGDAVQEEPTVVADGHREDTAMEVDGEDTKNELKLVDGK